MTGVPDPRSNLAGLSGDTDIFPVLRHHPPTARLNHILKTSSPTGRRNAKSQEQQRGLTQALPSWQKNIWDNTKKAAPGELVPALPQTVGPGSAHLSRPQFLHLYYGNSKPCPAAS